MCEATNCATNGALARRGLPDPTTRKLYVKQATPKSDTQYMVFFFFFFFAFDLRRGREERGALGADLFPWKGIYFLFGNTTRAFRILDGLGPGNWGMGMGLMRV